MGEKQVAPESIRDTVTELLRKRGLRPEEVVVLLASTKAGWEVWFYPQSANLEQVEQLLKVAFTKVQQLKEVKAMQQKKQKIDSMARTYTC